MNNPLKKDNKPTPSLSENPPYIKPCPDGFLLHLWVQPGAKKTTWSGSHGQQLKLAVQAPPVEGAANQTCLNFLAQWFGIRKGDVILLKGGKSRSKVVLVKGLTLERGLALIPVRNPDLLE